jgi:hypothetical protein
MNTDRSAKPRPRRLRALFRIAVIALSVRIFENNILRDDDHIAKRDPTPDRL